MHIYLITNTCTNKKYVGKTIQKVENRFQQHIRYSKKHNTKLSNAIKKYGKKTFVIEILENSIKIKIKNQESNIQTVSANTYPDIKNFTLDQTENSLVINSDILIDGIQSVSFAALVAFAKVQQANRGYKKRYEETGTAKNLDNRNNFSKLNMSPFRHMGGSGSRFSGMKIPKQPFRNLR
jgi:group I intron endonuclease